MVTFVSLFLWLITGIHTVEVAVDSGVDRVEILVDGELVTAMEGEPWKADVDFGQVIEPRELTAVAYDDKGDEVGRARQVVNLPRAEAEIGIALDRGEDGQPVSVRVVAENAERVQPASIVTTLDGQVLTQDKSGRFPLPAYDPQTIHILSAEVNYANGTVVRSDRSLGGNFGEIVASALTAIPVETSGEPPSAADLEGRLTIDGEKLRIAAVEHNGARIYVVRDLGASQALKSAGQANIRPFRAVRTKRDPVIEFELEPETNRLYLVGVNAAAPRGISLFPVAGPVSLTRWDIPWAVTSLFDRYTEEASQRLADAVAVAGIRAAGHGSPRAVVLVLSKDPEETSVYPMEVVKHYLEELRVPLRIWITEKKTSTSWGPATKTVSSKDFNQASKALLADLDRQWIVWVEGLHLVNRVKLDGADLGVTLVGVPAAGNEGQESN